MVVARLSPACELLYVDEDSYLLQILFYKHYIQPFKTSSSLIPIIRDLISSIEVNPFYFLGDVLLSKLSYLNHFMPRLLIFPKFYEIQYGSGLLHHLAHSMASFFFEFVEQFRLSVYALVVFCLSSIDSFHQAHCHSSAFCILSVLI